MRRLSLLCAVALALVLALPAAAQAEFGFRNLDVEFTGADESVSIDAGSHPFAMKTTIEVNVDGEGDPEGSVKDLIVDLPPGFVGDPYAVPQCSTVDFLTLYPAGHPLEGTPGCPDSAALGFLAILAPGNPVPVDFGVAYNLAPPPGVAAKLGFRVLSAFVTINVGVREEAPHNAFAFLENIAQIEPFAGSELTLWGNPASPAHDALRGACLVTQAADSCPAGIAVRPFLTLPRSCRGPLLTKFEMRSWQDPGTWVEGEAETHDDSIPPEPLGTQECDSLRFAPTIAAEPTTDRAESPSGLDFNLDIEDEGLTDPEGSAHSDIEKAVVTMPEGMTINPSIAAGLATCSEANLAGETLASSPGEGCPQASKVGTVEVETPLLEGKLLKGRLFVATQDENLVNSMIALYMVIKDPGLGILVKLPGKVEPDPETGQLVTTFGEPPYEVPQFPFSHFRFHFREGGRSPLITPPTCGTYGVDALFTPWAYPESPLAVPDTFAITSGVGGGPCPPGGTPPFQPGFEAGTIDNSAKSFSPFYMRLTRRDGDQDITRFSSVLPPGLVGKIAGLAKCPEAQIAAARAKSGRAELADPSCSADSKIGRTTAGAGVGSQLTYVPGSLYLAGPVGSAPLSVVAITPAVAGPFDAGTVVVRVALKLNPVSAQVEVDGANSEPIPHILKGIVLKLRDLRVHADRPNFTINPTSCAPSQVKATLFGSFTDVFDPADDVPVSLAERFQAADCASLGFKPKLAINLKGGTRRGDHPALRAVVTPREQDANFGAAVVTLPRSAFLDQAHIRTICTRVQFAAGAGHGANCPAGAQYGFARAWSPLLDEPLQGPVFLRSSDNNLPDLVVALKGLVDIELSARIDSVRGGIRSTFASVPDAPVSRFVLEMQGGQKGLIVNSRNLCFKPKRNRALANLAGQNGRRSKAKPAVRAGKCARKRSQKR